MVPVVSLPRHDFDAFEYFIMSTDENCQGIGESASEVKIDDHTFGISFAFQTSIFV